MRLIRLWPVLAGMLVGFLWVDASAQGNGSVTLTWTAPGDDSLSGTAARYDIRFSLFPIDESNFVYCTGPAGLPKPGSPGAFQRVTVFGLLPGLRYYFALKTADERLNWSRVSNVVAFAQPSLDVEPGIVRLHFDAPVPNPARSVAAFSYALPASAPVRIEIFDVQGRIVRMFSDPAMSAGARLLNWDLRDLSGARVPVGAYLVRARLGETEFIRRVIVAR